MTTLTVLFVFILAHFLFLF